jgi:hypothetical protein
MVGMTVVMIDVCSDVGQYGPSVRTHDQHGCQHGQCGLVISTVGVVRASVVLVMVNGSSVPGDSVVLVGLVDVILSGAVLVGVVVVGVYVCLIRLVLVDMDTTWVLACDRDSVGREYVILVDVALVDVILVGEVGTVVVSVWAQSD